MSNEKQEGEVEQNPLHDLVQHSLDQDYNNANKVFNDIMQVKLNDVLDSGKDLYGIKDFYNNYMKKNENRNYKIICVKYEDIFDKQDELSNLLGIGKLNLVNKSKRKHINEKKLDTIYADLIEEMNKNDSIIVN